MTIAKAILLNLKGKTITDVRVSDIGIVSLVFKNDEKVLLTVNLQKGVDYHAPKDRSSNVVKIDRVKKHAEKELEDDSLPKSPNRKHKKKVNND